MKHLTKDTLFKPTKAESKQAMTDTAARSILEAEAAERQKKTDRLRKMRLEVEAAAEKQKKKSGPAKRKTTSRATKA